MILSWISCFLKPLFVFNIWSTNTVIKSGCLKFLNTFQAWIYFLLRETCLLFQSFYMCKQNTLYAIMLLNGVLIPKLLNNQFAFCFFVSLDFLVSHAMHIFTLFVFENLRIFLSKFSYNSNNLIALSHQWIKTFNKPLVSCRFCIVSSMN